LISDFKKTFISVRTHAMNICAKFHSNPSTKSRDIASRGRDVNGQRTGRTEARTRKHNALRLLMLAGA